MQAQNAARAAQQMQQMNVHGMEGMPLDVRTGMPLHAQGQGAWMHGNSAGNTQPLGGRVAMSMRPNPYLLPNGRFRKPTHQDIISEIKLLEGIPENGSVVHRVEDYAESARHVCMMPPYLHYRQMINYQVVMPEFVTQVQYYAHRECGWLLIYKDSLP